MNNNGFSSYTIMDNDGFSSYTIIDNNGSSSAPLSWPYRLPARGQPPKIQLDDKLFCGSENLTFAASLPLSVALTSASLCGSWCSSLHAEVATFGPHGPALSFWFFVLQFGHVRYIVLPINNACHCFSGVARGAHIHFFARRIDTWPLVCGQS